MAGATLAEQRKNYTTRMKDCFRHPICSAIMCTKLSKSLWEGLYILPHLYHFYSILRHFIRRYWQDNGLANHRSPS